MNSLETQQNPRELVIWIIIIIIIMLPKGHLEDLLLRCQSKFRTSMAC